MIQVVKVEAENPAEYDFIRCPICHRRLCDKPKETKATVLPWDGCTENNAHVLVKCSKCGSLYIIAIRNQ